MMPVITYNAVNAQTGAKEQRRVILVGNMRIILGNGLDVSLEQTPAGEFRMVPSKKAKIRLKGDGSYALVTV